MPPTLPRLTLPLLALLPATASADVLRVDHDALPGGDGSSWATAYRFLQDALAHAANPAHNVTEIRVAEGTHLPDRSEASPDGTGDPTATLQLVSGVTLRGGYAGLGAANPDERDLDLYVTVLSGDLAGDDQPGFVNNDENSFHVVNGSGTDSTTALDGFRIVGGNAGTDSGAYGGGMIVLDGTPLISRCTFQWNAVGPHSDGGGAIGWRGGDMSLADCTFRNNTGRLGGAVLNRGSYTDRAIVTGCTFTNNTGATGGGITIFADSLEVTDCTFRGNTVKGGAAGLFANAHETLTVSRCKFVANTALAMGALSTGAQKTVVMDSIFIQNACDYNGGAMLDASRSLAMVNCVFSRNSGVYGGAAYLSFSATITNSTFANNSLNALVVDTGGQLSVFNTILWESQPFSTGIGGGQGVISVKHSDVKGGWPGVGNIDAAPLFVQPMNDDLRLSVGSPCVNAGDNGAPLRPPTDILGNPRIQGGIVDMGAYEGEFVRLEPAVTENDLDQGEAVMLVPRPGGQNLRRKPAMFVGNTLGPDNATFTVREFAEDLHPGAQGYSEITVNLTNESSLQEGDHLTTVYIPLRQEDLNGADPFRADVTVFDPAVGNWALAVSANSVNSPGFPGPIGNRIISFDGSGTDVTDQPGDYGVSWNASTQEGFAWANVDYTADFGVGLALCPADCLQTPDGEVGIWDLFAMFSAWIYQADGGPCDMDFDGVIDMTDLRALFDAWGPCPTIAAATGLAPRSPDLDGNDEVDRRDLITLQSSWGPCRGDCPGDLNRDDVTGVADLMILYSQWGSRSGQ